MLSSTTHVERTADAAVLYFPPEVDLANADDLRSGALRLLNRGVPALVMDLIGCRFCDSSGVNVILRAHIRAKALGTPLYVRLPATGLVRRICDIAGVTRLVPLADHSASPA
ncbi:STAS domain-containing protein [Actinomadura macrotermitis]|uniref:STAS domain-containing protein n=1 Tax=Actinomadura macrotermitis TaxID=2585200 RepID=A0A7K0BUX3_9ACTN|nr:STAS domain-containing protein [Actinomadura macrotermitis]MQY04692.1 hypothetical protein [Actinomadura macrotermitis]